MDRKIFITMLLCMVLVSATPAETRRLGAAPNEATEATCGNGPFNIDQALTDQAQRTTIAFSGLALITGNLEAQTFFPPGKLVDYWGFQYLRDNDPDEMGHNTSFLTRVSCNVLYLLDQDQLEAMVSLARGQVAQINGYGYKRYPLMKAFRRLVDGDLPVGATGLDLDAVKAASRELYELDGQISFDRAAAFAAIFRSLSPSQKSYLDAMVGKGWKSWPDKDMDDVRDKMRGLTQDESVAVMTYAGDIFSWYAGCVEADIYFCPERHGTYYGGFYIKDAPAIGHEGYSINEQLTATAGAALCDSSKGYVTPSQAALVSSLTDMQRDNLYLGASNIVKARTEISTALRSLITSSEPTGDFLAQVRAAVIQKSGIYGELDGENNYHYATVFAQLDRTLTDEQRANLAELRRSILSGTYSDGTPFDFTVCTNYYLFSAVVNDQSTLDQYISDTDYLFGVDSAAEASFSFLPASPSVGQEVGFTDTSRGDPTWWSWNFGDGATSSLQNPVHVYTSAGTFTVALEIGGGDGTDSVSRQLTVGGFGALALASEAGADGGTMPAEYTCDGSGASPAFNWSNAPAGTTEFALMMTTIPVDGGTKWNWVLYGIPGTVTGLARNSTGVGILGVGTNAGRVGYDPPCSQGPGPKLYTFTLYALSASPSLPAGQPVTGDALTRAISPVTLGSASITLSYSRPEFKASFTYAPDVPREGVAVTFTASASGGTAPYTYVWDLAGKAASGEVVTNSFAVGTSTVTLTVHDAKGATSSCSKTIRVMKNTGKAGDCDGDNLISIGELQLAVNMFLGIEVPGCGLDCDNDGRASIAEVQKVVSGFLGEPAEC